MKNQANPLVHACGCIQEDTRPDDIHGRYAEADQRCRELCNEND